jgi:uncharacterized protein YeaO (DUF488 family)
MVKIYTSQYGYKGEDRLDITVKTGDKTFAPTWDMVMGHKNGTLSSEQYVKMYIDLLRNSYKKNRKRWEEILNREQVTFVCFCGHGKFCHRLILADVFTKLGATYKGEVDRNGNLIK